nr:hypothetical transcript [Hymenolepis microstoma]
MQSLLSKSEVIEKENCCRKKIQLCLASEHTLSSPSASDLNQEKKTDLSNSTTKLKLINRIAARHFCVVVIEEEIVVER